MNVKSIFILILLAFCWIISWRHYTCSIKGFCGDNDKSSVTLSNTMPPIQFHVNTDSPVLSNFDSYRDSICTHSKSSFIEVVGYYYANETNTTPFENLGLARAEKLASLLNGCKDSMSKILIKGIQRDGNSTSDILLTSDVAISQMPMGLTDSKEVQIITTNNVTEIYFPSGSDKELTSEKLDQFLSEVAMNSGQKKIVLTGHTDNVGDEEANVRLSLNRCNTIKSSLVKLGAVEQNISCEGKGSSLPKLENTSPENRAINRRVELKYE